jgi:hypothetical protein
MNARVQVPQIALQVRLVRIPCETIHPWRRRFLQLEGREAQEVDGDMVQERCEPDAFIPPCGVTYAVQCG